MKPLLGHYTVKELCELQKSKKNTKAGQRLCIIIKAREHKSVREIAKDLMIPRSTVHNMIKRIRERGIRGLYDDPHPGRPCKLDWEQLKHLRRDLLAGTEKFGFKAVLWKAELVAVHIRRTFGVKYELSSVRVLLKRLGMSYKKPRPFNPKTPPKGSRRRSRPRYTRR